jgi:pimeloyl-ACP methyl ester carboxylesterase
MPEERMTTVIGSDGTRLSARVFPAPAPGSPGLLMLHGLASSQHIWDRMLPRLTRRFHVVTYDARGHGLSAKPDRRYGFDHVRADALAVALATGLRRPIVAGHSWGAMVALEIAAHEPRSIAAAALVDGGLRSLRADMDWATTKEQLAPPVLAGMPVEEFRALMRTMLAGVVEVSPEVEAQVLSVMRVRRDGTIAPRLARSNHLRILRAIWEQDTEALWMTVRAPVLAIAARSPDDAGRDRNAATRASMRRIAELTRGRPVTLESMRGVHDLPLQHPEVLARRIERFARTAVG